MEFLEVTKIWDKAPHNAFTDLIRFDDFWYCAFRESDSHMATEGKLRVIRSFDGKKWDSVALMKWDNKDVRDAKLSITNNNELMLNGAVRFVGATDGKTLQSLTWLSKDGLEWSEAYACPTGYKTWRWSTTWHKGIAYSIGYAEKDKFGCLYSSKDGKEWEEIKRDMFPDFKSYWNETSLVFLDNDDAYCLLRRDSGTYTSMLGYSKPPYDTWQWNDLGVPIGGPKMISLDNKDKFLAAVRLYSKDNARTSLCWIDYKNSSFEETLTLPSSGDTSYAGMVYYENILWVSYYSSHEDKTSIYLAKVKL